MEITQVKIFPVHEDKLKAFVSVVFDHCFMVNDIKVIQGKDGLFLSMPSRRKKTGEFKDVAHPLNNEMRRLLEEEVLGEYRQMVDDPTPRRPDRQEDGEGEMDFLHKSGSPLAAAGSAEPAPLAETAARPPLAAPGDSLVAPGDSPVTPGDSLVAPGDSGRPEIPAPGEGAQDKTLEEVQELHLSDSFWSVR